MHPWPMNQWKCRVHNVDLCAWFKCEYWVDLAVPPLTLSISQLGKQTCDLIPTWKDVRCKPYVCLRSCFSAYRSSGIMIIMRFFSGTETVIFDTTNAFLIAGNLVFCWCTSTRAPWNDKLPCSTASSSQSVCISGCQFWHVLTSCFYPGNYGCSILT